MEYVLLRYRRNPSDVVSLASTADPSEAVDLVRRWSRRAADEGLIVSLADRPIVHCAPRRR